MDNKEQSLPKLNHLVEVRGFIVGLREGLESGSVPFGSAVHLAISDWDTESIRMQMFNNSVSEYTRGQVMAELVALRETKRIRSQTDSGYGRLSHWLGSYRDSFVGGRDKGLYDAMSDLRTAVRVLEGRE